MDLLHRFSHLLQEPPPEYALELSSRGIAYVRPGRRDIGFAPLAPGVLSISPLRDNVLQPDALKDALVPLVPPPAKNKRRSAVLILPDFSARVAVLDFDAFPSDPKEQLSLVRFRMRKTVPFDIESAVVGYARQPKPSPASKKVSIVVAAAGLEIVGRYEAVLRAAGLHPGLVTTSALALAELEPLPATQESSTVSVIAKLDGFSLTVCVIQGGQLKLVRCVEITACSHEELAGVLFPTVAYVEDELGVRPSRLLLCGFDNLTPADADAGGPGAACPQYGPQWESELGVPVLSLSSKFGLPAAHNAGLLGYLQSLGATAGAYRV